MVSSWARVKARTVLGAGLGLRPGAWREWRLPADDLAAHLLELGQRDVAERADGVLQLVASVAIVLDRTLAAWRSRQSSMNAARVRSGSAAGSPRGRGSITVR